MTPEATLIAGLAALVLLVVTVWWARRGRAPLMESDSSTGERKPVCPSCRRGFVHRSKARNSIERVRREYFNPRLFRCGECGWRGWLEVMDPGLDSQFTETEVDLRALDGAGGDVPSALKSGKKKPSQKRKRGAGS